MFLMMSTNLLAQKSVAPDSLKRDPVCNMKVAKNSSHIIKYQKKEHRFCSDFCKKEFVNHPDKYLKNK